MTKHRRRPAITETTPSRAQYFSWINNTNEGAAEDQTLANLEFFAWLRREYGMQLDIYAFDAGAVDGARFYGSTDSDRFRRQFPRGFGPLYRKARDIGCRLGLWGGPDGFGTTPAEERKRIAMMVALCRDYGFALFKLDGVCGPLRPEKEDAFVRQMVQCRKHSPDLIVLNHRLKLGKGMPHTTTFLWEGRETYIDVHTVNSITAMHNRACALERGLVPELKRLTEDHGVCLSSCLDFWEDDLVLQAFNRCLILAPEIYGNPWLLRDDEYPRLARIFNLHRRYRDILVNGMTLPADRFGPYAVSRGNATTRLLTLRNLTWYPVVREIPLDASIGLQGTGGPIEVRRFHPHERILGRFARGSKIEVEVAPFRACLLIASRKPIPEAGVTGCDYDVVRDVPGRPVAIRLLGEPGTSSHVRPIGNRRAASTVTLDGRRVSARDGCLLVRFPGRPRTSAWHRKIGDLVPVPVPADAESLCEATFFAADNNALEVRELLRSGPTAVPEVQRARDTFFDQPVFRQRSLWDRYLFDHDPNTAFAVCRRWSHADPRIRGGSLRLNLGKPTRIDRLVLEVGSEYELQPVHSEECIQGAVSADLRNWRTVYFYADKNVGGNIPDGQPVRYVRLDACPDRIREVRGYYRGKALDRTGWRATNLFAGRWWNPVVAAWSLRFRLSEVVPGAYLCVPVHGQYGTEAVYAALRIGRTYRGAPRRSPSYPSNTWECPVRRTEGNYTYYIPLDESCVNRPSEAVVLLLKWGNPAIRPEAWLTAYPTPLASRELVIASP